VQLCWNDENSIMQQTCPSAAHFAEPCVQFLDLPIGSLALKALQQRKGTRIGVLKVQGGCESMYAKEHAVSSLQ